MSSPPSWKMSIVRMRTKRHCPSQHLFSPHSVCAFVSTSEAAPAWSGLPGREWPRIVYLISAWREKKWPKKKKCIRCNFHFQFLLFFFFFLRFLINTRSQETCPWRLLHLTSCLKVWRYINAPGSHNYVSSVFLVSFWPAAYFWWSVNESIYFTAFEYK